MTRRGATAGPDLPASEPAGDGDRAGPDLDALERTIAAREPEVRALVPEPGGLDRLRAEAAALGRREGPLLGLLVGVKDIFHVDGLPTRAGSRLPPGELAGREAASVRALRNAGALVLGKTATTEFAYFAPGRDAEPRSIRVRTPGGSSQRLRGRCRRRPTALWRSGRRRSARSADRRRIAASVGFKPTYDRVLTSRGHPALAPSVDHVGLPSPPAVATGARLAASVLIGGLPGLRAERSSGLAGRPCCRCRRVPICGARLPEPIGRRHCEAACEAPDGKPAYTVLEVLEIIGRLRSGDRNDAIDRLVAAEAAARARGLVRATTGRTLPREDGGA